MCVFFFYVLRGVTDLIYAVVITSVIYPVVAHWAWSNDGWASPYLSDDDDLLLGCGVADFSGSAVVHLTGHSQITLRLVYCYGRRQFMPITGVARIKLILSIYRCCIIVIIV